MKAQLRRETLEDMLGERVDEYENYSATSNTKQHRKRVPLWKFLLHLLNRDITSRYVYWNKDYPLEFCITDTNGVADLWGSVKNKSDMTYEKFSRALRYYYGKNIIEKVHGRRYSYRFILSWRTRKYISKFFNISDVKDEENISFNECNHLPSTLRSSFEVLSKEPRSSLGLNHLLLPKENEKNNLEKPFLVHKTVGEITAEFINSQRTSHYWYSSSQDFLPPTTIDMFNSAKIRLISESNPNILKLFEEPLSMLPTNSFALTTLENVENNYSLQKTDKSIYVTYEGDKFKNVIKFSDQTHGETIETDFLATSYKCRKDPFMGSNSTYSYDDKNEFENQTSLNDLFEN
ncbi:uncharacterized protein LOC105844054 isoform X3 [Hydra vulgaris]